MDNDPPDYTSAYNTQLTPAGERLFLQQMAHRLDDLRDYDLRGAWLANAQAAANGHLPDSWKKPNHPTFSTGSIYATPQTPGGVWAQLSNQEQSPWAYVPSATNTGIYGRDNLLRYFAQREAGNFLLPPQ
jgi:hypothetical protein